MKYENCYKTFQIKLYLRSPASLLFVLASLLGQACSGNQTVNVKESNETIVIDLEGNIGKGNIVDLSSVVSDIEYIPLETSDSSLVGDSKKIYFENGRIFFVSGQINQTNKMLQVYDSLGRHLLCFDRQQKATRINLPIMSVLLMAYWVVREILCYTTATGIFQKISCQDRRFSVSEVLKMNDDTYARLSIILRKP